MPKTKLGKWSIILIIAMPVLFFIGTTLLSAFYPAEPSGNTILEDVMNRPGLALSMLAGMSCGIAAFVTGLIALTKKKERSILVYVSTILGGLLLVFLIGEFLFPH
jgi:hypothetical protein